MNKNRILVKFSGKMWLMIILKVTKNQSLHPLSRKHIFRKTTKGVVKLTPQPF